MQETNQRFTQMGSNNSNINNFNVQNNNNNMLNNSSVPSAALLGQVANMANLPNQGGGGGATSTAANKVQMQIQPHNNSNNPPKMKINDTMKLLMESMKRSEMSRNLCKQYSSPFSAAEMAAAASKASLKSSSSTTKQSVVKAKRNSVRTKEKLTAAAHSRGHARSGSGSKGINTNDDTN